MKKYHIGLDFGTYQSKVCVYDIENDTHEFFQFENGTFFIPSRVCLTRNDKFLYGDKPSDYKEEYTYFKIASAEDEEFHSETFGTGNPILNFYKFNEFNNYSPEFLSVIYLTNLLFIVKGKYKKTSSKNENTGGLLGRLFQSNTAKQKTKFTVQLGIPTEWSHEKNIRRKRKFENILILAELLQKEYSTHEIFLSKSANQLKSDVHDLYTSHNFTNKNDYQTYLNNLGLSVYSETAAGLTFIVKSGQLLPGYYAILDIGGGSSDVSFFSVINDQKIRYLASESYMIAANNVYSKTIVKTDSVEKLGQAEIKVRKQIEDGKWKGTNLETQLKYVNQNINSVLYKLFNKRVYFFDRDMIKKFKDQPVILYGGGSKLPIINSGKIKIHDNGVRANRNGRVTEEIIKKWTFMEKQKIERYSSIINILPSTNTWKNELPLLVVALGLSFIHSPGDTDWFSDEYYKPKDGTGDRLVPHPFNEGYFIYDVLNSKWK